LIEELGRLDTAGRPIQYGTTFAFLQHFGLRGLEDMPSLQPEESAALQVLAEQGQAISVDLATPADRVEAAAPVLDRPTAPIETQLSLLGDEAPAAGHADAVAAELDTIAPSEELAVEMMEADRVSEASAAIQFAPDQPETAIEPQASAEESANDNAAL
jgi:hypothetical protein